MESKRASVVLGFKVRKIQATVLQRVNREFKQIATAGAITVAVTGKVWGEYVSVVCQILAKRTTKMAET